MAPRFQAAESSLKKKQETELGFPTAPRCLHSSSHVWLLGQAALAWGQLPEALAMGKVACSILQPSLLSFLPRLFTWGREWHFCCWPCRKPIWLTEVHCSFGSHFFSALLQEHMARMKTQFLAERELRHCTLAAQKVPVDRCWSKEAKERLLKAVSWGTWHRQGCRHQCPAFHGWGGCRASSPRVPAARG